MKAKSVLLFAVFVLVSMFAFQTRIHASFGPVVELEFDNPSYQYGDAIHLQIYIGSVTDLYGIQIDVLENPNFEFLDSTVPFTIENTLLEDGLSTIFINQVNGDVGTFLALRNATEDALSIDQNGLIVKLTLTALVEMTNPSSFFAVTNDFDDLTYGDAPICIKLSNSVGLSINYSSLYSTRPNITLIGDFHVQLEAGDEYKEDGVNCDPEDALYVSGHLDTTTPGVYVLEYYTISELGRMSNVLTREIVVVDTTSPEFDIIPNQTIRVEATNQDWTVLIHNASDNSSGALTKAEVQDEVQYGVVGTYTVIVSLTDVSGNCFQREFQVEIIDDIAPSFDVILNQTIEAGVANIDWTTRIQNAMDNASTPLIYHEVSDSVEYNTVGTYQVTVGVSDASGNSSNRTFQVNVVDTTPPTFDISNQTINAEEYTNVDWTIYITNMHDNATGMLIKSEVTDNVNYSVAGDYLVTVRVTDSSSNHQDMTFTVHVIAIQPTLYTITFYDDDHVTVLYTFEIESGATVTSQFATKNGYTFEGWFLESGTEYDFSSVITDDLNLYAHYTKNTGCFGGLFGQSSSLSGMFVIGYFIVRRKKTEFQ